MGWREMYRIMANAFRTKKKKKKMKFLEVKDAIKLEDQNEESQVPESSVRYMKNGRKVPKNVSKVKIMKSQVSENGAKDKIKESQVPENVAKDKIKKTKVLENVGKDKIKESLVPEIVVKDQVKESEVSDNEASHHRESKVQFLVPGDCVSSNDTTHHHSPRCSESEDDVFEKKMEPRKRFTATSEVSAEALSEEDGNEHDLSREFADESRPRFCVDHRNEKSASMPKCEGARPRIDKELFIYVDNDEGQCTPDHFQNARIVRQRGRRNNSSSHIKVKYTKVYGEGDGAYRNDSTPRGLVFICNFSKFEDDTYPERKGSEKDYENLMNLFQQMGYGHSHRHNTYCLTGYVTEREFMDKIDAFSRERKHEVLCSCVVIIMSHGSGPKKFITSDNKEVDLMKVYSIFDNINCRLLRGKPKIFILQFCRNTVPESSGMRDKRPIITEIELRKLIHDEVQKAFQTQQHTREDEDPVVSINPKSLVFLNIEEISRNASISSLSSLIDLSSPQVADESQRSTHTQDLADDESYHTDTRNLPVVPQEGFQRYSDMYSIFSTSPGELSHRHPRKGSLLIQAICHVFAEFAYQDEIDNLVRKVSTYMTKTLQRDDPITVPRQTCERTNNGLDKFFYFNPAEIPFSRHVTI